VQLDWKKLRCLARFAKPRSSTQRVGREIIEPQADRLFLAILMPKWCDEWDAKMRNHWVDDDL
jgi:hypothetical protein